MKKKNVITYGRKFRDKSGQTVRYVYKHRKKIGVVILLAADAYLPDSEAELNRNKADKPSIRQRVRREIDVARAIYHHHTLLWVLSPKKRR